MTHGAWQCVRDAVSDFIDAVLRPELDEKARVLQLEIFDGAAPCLEARPVLRRSPRIDAVHGPDAGS